MTKYYKVGYVDKQYSFWVKVSEKKWKRICTFDISKESGYDLP